MRESEVEKHLFKRVKAAGGFAYKFKSPNRNNVPDRLVVLPLEVTRRARHRLPQSFFVELKRPGEEPNDGQLREHKRLRDLGQKVYVADTKERVDEILKEYGVLPC
ncbi:VRR-NUC domain-containing protein [Asticcacaulis sp.]|uniref:VRR-NUC domain-containing protein n=1 Tax=Asticcacaulis sp. TaxID=1872648 RepID=UPI0031CF878E